MKSTLLFTLSCFAACAPPPEVKGQSEGEIIVVTGSAPPDCRAVDPGWDNTYDSAGNWTGCVCTYGCTTESAPHGPLGNPPPPTGGGGGSGPSEHDRVLAAGQCTQQCNGPVQSNFSACLDHGPTTPSWCPVSTGSASCPGIPELCRHYGELPDNTRLPTACTSLRIPIPLASCESLFRSCEDAWHYGGLVWARSYRAMCTAQADKIHRACNTGCLAGLDGMKCDASDGGSVVINDGTMQHGRCTRGDGGWVDCASPSNQCKYGPDA